MSAEDIDRALEQSGKGVEELRRQLFNVFRLPRRYLRLR